VDDWLFCRASIQNRAISFQRRISLMTKEQGQDQSQPPTTELYGTQMIHGEDGLESVAALLPYVTLANHDDLLGSSTSMGNKSYAPPPPLLPITHRYLTVLNHIHHHSYLSISYCS
jgi:hypothetical protein